VGEAQPIRFSIQMPDATDVAAWTQKVRRAEDNGFYSVSVPDHLSPNLPQLAPLVALAAAAMVTSRVRLAITVIDNDFRHPVMLAKEVATLDLLSRGRIDLGMGAGWLPEDYTATGVATWDPPGQRVGRLIEAMALVRELFRGEPVTFHGEHYQVDGFRLYPRPVQAPIPLMVGGAGKRMLTMAARGADIISLIVPLDGSADTRRAAFEQQLGWIGAAAGDRGDLTVGLRILFGEVVEPGQSRRAAAERVGAGRGMSAAEALESPFGLVGDLAAIRDHVLQIRERYGISYFTVSEDLAWQVAPIVGELSGGED
jgi:probable F420-dependent oxidoreductase